MATLSDTLLDQKSILKKVSWRTLLNVMIVGLYTVNFGLRIGTAVDVTGWPVALSCLGMTMLGVSGWLDATSKNGNAEQAMRHRTVKTESYRGPHRRLYDSYDKTRQI